MDIPENEIASYITATKLLRDTLTKGQRACLVLNLHEYEFRSGQGKRTDLCPNEQKLDTAKILADEAGISRVQMVRLKEVKRKRPELFEKVFEGSYLIGKAHAEMKRDEAPPTTAEERTATLIERTTQRRAYRFAMLIPTF